MELKIIDFRYTKDDGQKTDRKLLVLDSPTDSYLGIEISEDLTPVMGYIKYLEELVECTAKLKEKHAVNFMNLPYKRFKQSKITKLLEQKLSLDTNKV